MKPILVNYRFLFLLFFLLISPLLNSCGGSSQPTSNPSLADGVYGPEVTGEPTAFRGAGKVGDAKYLIGGPLAQGRVGDILLQNDKIRVIIQKPRRNAGVALYGGNIIDADILRPAGEPGRDNFGITFPLINVSWTPFYKRLEIINGDFSKGPIVIRATGILNVYDYIQTSIIVPFAKISKGVKLFFPEQFNDVLDPFQTLPRLRAISSTVVTDYILRPDQPYVILQTYLQNSGSEPVPMPIGDWVNSSGTLETFIPGIGFTGQGLYSSTNVPALIYPGMETDTGVSYGYFYDPDPFKKSDGTYRSTDLLTVSGVSILALGERIAPGLIPAITKESPAIAYSLQPGKNEYVRYFAVGNGDAASVLTSGLQALNISTASVSGTVVDPNNGNAPVPSARVYAVDTTAKKTSVMFVTDANGKFSGNISTGVDTKAKLFGSGTYRFEVYKEGYLSQDKWTDTDAPNENLRGQNKAGRTCTVSNGDLTKIQCQLGESATVKVTSNGPARIAVVGFDPSPFHKLPAVDINSVADDQSAIADIEFQGQQYGYIDAFFLNRSGNEIMNKGDPRYVSDSTFRLEPGTYMIFVTRGPEYSMERKTITLAAGQNEVFNTSLTKVVDTKEYISGDFHIHGINSPDSPYGLSARVNFALAEGLDIMVSADHDVITDYSSTIQALGVQDLVSSIAGDEITPMAFGHFIVFPLLHKPEDPMGGAFDYTKKDGFNPGPSHHEVLSPGETLAKIDELNPGEQVLQVNHIEDPLLGNWALSGLLTSTHFPDAPPLSTFSRPVDFRLRPDSDDPNHLPPYPYGTNSMFTADFTAVELCIGEDAKVTSPNLYETALPMWFDFLNLGKVATATCSSDTHRQIREPIGSFRNYIVSPEVDPRDGTGTYAQLDPQKIAKAVNQHQVVVSAGPFVKVTASKPDGSDAVTVGGTLSGTKEVKLSITVQSPDWMDWDRVEIYVNTDPTPAKDDLSAPWDKTAKEFVTPSSQDHLTPKYCYAPLISFERTNTLDATTLPTTCKNWWVTPAPENKKLVERFSLNQVVKNGLRSTTIDKTISLTQDSWIVVMVKGSATAHSIFPYAPKAANTQNDTTQDKFLATLEDQIKKRIEPQDPVDPDPAKMPADKIGGTKAFAFTNPILVDVDGNGWTAIYKDKSPLK